VQNAADNCARARNPDQHDEDADGFGDACDNCPAIANPTQADTSELDIHAFPDGVGDACDPRPGAGGDELRAFYSFAHESQASAWTGDGFTVSGDALHATGNARWTSTRVAAGDGVLVIAEVTSATLSAQGALVIALDGDGASSGETCTFTAQLVTAAAAGGETSSVGLAGPIEPDQQVRLAAWRTIANTPGGRVAEISCRVTQGAATKQTAAMLVDDIVTGSHAIAARDASADISSLAIYTAPGPKTP
jgi:hypothetical protein